MIQFIRVDDRVIHGQTIACWINEFPCNGIILVDDKLAGDTVMGNIYRNAVPSDIKVHIFTVDKALQKLDEIKISSKNYYIIFKSVQSMEQLLRAGAVFENDINVGPSSTRPGTTVIIPTIGLDHSEIELYKKVAAKGYRIYFQTVPGTKRVWWEDAVKKLKD